MFRALAAGGWLAWPGDTGYSARHDQAELLHPREDGYLRNVATSASKKVSDSMRETAQTIKKTVEEHKIGNLLDMTIIGNFNKEQEKFMSEQKSKKSESALPPWAGYNNEESVKQQVLSLSEDRRNFLRDPPAGVRFSFDFNTVAPVAVVMLHEDKLLSKMRFELVPKLVKEEQFWKNYFYRISLIKQSVQLLSQAAGQPENSRDEPDASESSLPATDSVLSSPSTVPVRKQNESAGAPSGQEVSISPTANEFVSDAFDTSFLNQEDILRGMEQLGMSSSQPAPGDEADDIPEWEKELQRELQEFEIVEGKAKVSDAWEKEIEALLQEED
ncbi:synapse-associated protein 1-like isoform X2 [Leucoraja erinacea]|uniref:synapse-associated protein 1-like isoform X2 n=1 Tax=Leucoraja erinaceus TaxID=7782 RepID=UPI0024558716|nr:synapse-associated protein 1-like isoform X2 [Leucoraja erinacea]